MATVNLGRIKPVFKSTWANGTTYAVDDFVVHGNECYICIQAGSGQNPTSASAYWTKIAAKGTDGTDVGATLTTQGDILFRDGSGLQRLAKGTAGQDLRMNSGATAPEWYTASGGGILQMKTLNYDVIHSFNNSTYNYINSNFKVDITPTASDSKFLLQACLTIGFDNHDCGGGFGFMDSQVGAGDANVIPPINNESSGVGSRTQTSIGGSGSWAGLGDVENYLTETVHLSTMYTPAAQNTNQRTFHVASKRNSYNGAMQLNAGQINNSLTNASVSTIIVMEVANSIT